MTTPTLGTGVSSLPPEGARFGLERSSAETTDPALLDVRGLRVAFGGKEVVHGVDFSIQPGEKLALVGESGSGKTVTALSLLKLALNADVSGSAQFGGRDLLALPERELRGIRGSDIAMIFQEPMTALNPLFTVGDQIAEVLQLKQGINPASLGHPLLKALASTGIPEPARRAMRYPAPALGRTAPARDDRHGTGLQPANCCWLMSPPPRWMSRLRAQILDLLSELQAKKRDGGAADHARPESWFASLPDRVAVMEHGHHVEQGVVAGGVLPIRRHPYTRKLIDSRPVRDVALKRPN
jgi:microcin C transport system ATP-binding protein